MSTTKHTPEPWAVSEINKSLVISGKHCIADCSAPPVSKPWEEREANAKLIAAAPDMLRALKTAHFALQELAPGTYDKTSLFQDITDVLNAATK